MSTPLEQQLSERIVRLETKIESMIGALEKLSNSLEVLSKGFANLDDQRKHEIQITELRLEMQEFKTKLKTYTVLFTGFISILTVLLDISLRYIVGEQ